MPSDPYRKSYFGDMILWVHYLPNGISFTGKMTSSFWNGSKMDSWMEREKDQCKIRMYHPQQWSEEVKYEKKKKQTEHNWHLPQNLSLPIYHQGFPAQWEHVLSRDWCRRGPYWWLTTWCQWLQWAGKLLPRDVVTESGNRVTSKFWNKRKLAYEQHVLLTSYKDAISPV